MRRLQNLVAFLIYLSVMLAFALSCTEGPTSSSPAPSVATGTSNSPASKTTNGTSSSNACNVVGLRRSHIKLEVKDGVLNLLIPAEPEVGEGYFILWDPEVNDGTRYGPYPINEWVSIGPFPPGSYDMRLAAETKAEGVVYQCDRHRIQFVVSDEPPKAECPPESFVDIKLIPALNLVVECPAYRLVAYDVSQKGGLDVELTLPEGCAEGTCKLPVEVDDYSVSFTAVGYFKGLQCASDFETFVVKGCSPQCVCDEREPTIQQQWIRFLISSAEPFTFAGQSYIPGDHDISVDAPECGEVDYYEFRSYADCDPDLTCYEAVFTVEGVECPCVPPEEQFFKHKPPYGPPAAECAAFGDYVPAETAAAFYVVKCGNWYLVTHEPYLEATCPNGQDVSHITPCGCEEIVR